jgi:hypothetical protein
VGKNMGTEVAIYIPIEGENIDVQNNVGG